MRKAIGAFSFLVLSASLWRLSCPSFADEQAGQEGVYGDLARQAQEEINRFKAKDGNGSYAKFLDLSPKSPYKEFVLSGKIRTPETVEWGNYLIKQIAEAIPQDAWAGLSPDERQFKISQVKIWLDKTLEADRDEHFFHYQKWMNEKYPSLLQEQNHATVNDFLIPAELFLEKAKADRLKELLGPLQKAETLAEKSRWQPSDYPEVQKASDQLKQIAGRHRLALFLDGRLQQEKTSGTARTQMAQAAQAGQGYRTLQKASKDGGKNLGWNTASGNVPRAIDKPAAGESNSPPNPAQSRLVASGKDRFELIRDGQEWPKITGRVDKGGKFVPERIENEDGSFLTKEGNLWAHCEKGSECGKHRSREGSTYYILPDGWIADASAVRSVQSARNPLLRDQLVDKLAVDFILQRYPHWRDYNDPRLVHESASIASFLKDVFRNADSDADIQVRFGKYGDVIINQFQGDGVHQLIGKFEPTESGWGAGKGIRYATGLTVYGRKVKSLEDDQTEFVKARQYLGDWGMETFSSRAESNTDKWYWWIAGAKAREASVVTRLTRRPDGTWERRFITKQVRILFEGPNLFEAAEGAAGAVGKGFVDLAGSAAAFALAANPVYVLGASAVTGAGPGDVQKDLLNRSWENLVHNSASVEVRRSLLDETLKQSDYHLQNSGKEVADLGHPVLGAAVGGSIEGVNGLPMMLPMGAGLRWMGGLGEVGALAERSLGLYMTADATRGLAGAAEELWKNRGDFNSEGGIRAVQLVSAQMINGIMTAGIFIPHVAGGTARAGEGKGFFHEELPTLSKNVELPGGLRVLDQSLSEFFGVGKGTRDWLSKMTPEQYVRNFEMFKDEAGNQKVPTQVLEAAARSFDPWDRTRAVKEFGITTEQMNLTKGGVLPHINAWLRGAPDPDVLAHNAELLNRLDFHETFVESAPKDFPLTHKQVYVAAERNGRVVEVSGSGKFSQITEQNVKEAKLTVLRLEEVFNPDGLYPENKIHVVSGGEISERGFRAVQEALETSSWSAQTQRRNIETLAPAVEKFVQEITVTELGTSEKLYARVSKFGEIISVTDKPSSVGKSEHLVELSVRTWPGRRLNQESFQTVELGDRHMKLPDMELNWGRPREVRLAASEGLPHEARLNLEETLRAVNRDFGLDRNRYAQQKLLVMSGLLESAVEGDPQLKNLIPILRSLFEQGRVCFGRESGEFYAIWDFNTGKIVFGQEALWVPSLQLVQTLGHEVQHALEIPSRAEAERYHLDPVGYEVSAYKVQTLVGRNLRAVSEDRGMSLTQEDVIPYPGLGPDFLLRQSRLDRGSEYFSRQRDLDYEHDKGELSDYVRKAYVRDTVLLDRKALEAKAFDANGGLNLSGTVARELAEMKGRHKLTALAIRETIRSGVILPDPQGGPGVLFRASSAYKGTDLEGRSVGTDGYLDVLVDPVDGRILHVLFRRARDVERSARQVAYDPPTLEQMRNSPQPLTSEQRMQAPRVIAEAESVPVIPGGKVRIGRPLGSAVEERHSGQRAEVYEAMYEGREVALKISRDFPNIPEVLVRKEMALMHERGTYQNFIGEIEAYKLMENPNVRAQQLAEFERNVGETFSDPHTQEQAIQAGRWLRLADQAATYTLPFPEAVKRVRGLAKELSLPEEILLKGTPKFMEDLRQDPYFNEWYAKLPENYRRRFHENLDGFRNQKWDTVDAAHAKSPPVQEQKKPDSVQVSPAQSQRPDDWVGKTFKADPNKGNRGIPKYVDPRTIQNGVPVMRGMSWEEFAKLLKYKGFDPADADGGKMKFVSTDGTYAVRLAKKDARPGKPGVLVRFTGAKIGRERGVATLPENAEFQLLGFTGFEVIRVYSVP